MAAMCHHLPSGQPAPCGGRRRINTFQLSREPTTAIPLPTMTSAAPILVRVAVALLGIGGVLGQVAYIDAVWWHSLGLAPEIQPSVGTGLGVLLTAHGLVSLTCAAFAIGLALHEGPREAAARGLAVALAAWGYLMAYGGITMLLRPDPGLARLVFEGHFLFVEMLGLVGLLRFSALFPRPLLESGLEVPPTLPAALVPLHALSVRLCSPAATWATGAMLLVVLWALAVLGGGSPADAGLGTGMVVVRLAAASLVVVNLRRGWNRADAEGRARLQWLVVSLCSIFAALAVVIGGRIWGLVAGLPQPPVAWHPYVLDLGQIGFFGGFTMAVLYGGPVRPREVIDRLTAASGALVLGFILAAALEALLSGGVIVSSSIRAGTGTVLALAVMVSTYKGFARRVRRLMPQM